MTTNNPHFGPTRNPWNLEHIPGGSSGGSGAAIAAGLATATTGTDTGGSIRMPASVCGVVGLKPTYGRVSKAGVLPLSYLFDHAGPITRTVEDAALVLNAIAGYDPADATTVRTPVRRLHAPSSAAALRGLRIGVPRAYFFDAPRGRGRARPSSRRSPSCARLGADVRDVEIPGVEAGFGAIFGLVLAEAQEIHARSLRTRRADFGADVLALLSSADARRDVADAGAARARRAQRRRCAARSSRSTCSSRRPRRSSPRASARRSSATAASRSRS